ncbi:MAG: HEPN domain-containing protein [Deltaproteobacteria bacterium]|nr:HEPN domain-containing protein [Deltaproteobacteria bacterium]
MKAGRDAEFRLRLAEGFLAEAEEDIRLSRWRSCVDNAQMCVENAAKAVIAMRGPVPKVHQLEEALAKLLKDTTLKSLRKEIAILQEIAGKLGFEEHVRTDYGDESEYRTPWELFDEESAEEALDSARKAHDAAKRIVGQWPQKKKK